MQRIRFGVTLPAGIEAHRDALALLGELMSADTGSDVEACHFSRPDALASAMAEGAIDVAWMSPTLLLMTPALDDAVPLLASVRRGSAMFHAILFCAQSALFEDANDLDGTRAAWVAATSASGYLVPRLSLAHRGYDVHRMFAAETFHDTHGAVCRAVLSGAADIGATYAHFEGADPKRRLVGAGFQEGGAFARARVIDVSGPIPADMIVSRAAVPLGARAAVAASLARLVHDPVGAGAVAEIIGAEDFRAVTHEAIAELGDLVAAARRLERGAEA